MNVETAIKNLINYDKKNIGEKKALVVTLAEELEKAIKEKNFRILNQLKMLELEEDISSIALLIKWIIEKNNLSISDKWVTKNLHKRFKKEPKVLGGNESPTVRLSDKYIEEHADELMDRIKEVTPHPAQDIKIKVRKETIDLQGWKTKIALELVELAKKIDEDEIVDKELEKEIAERLRMVRDGRFATTWAHYEAIIAAVNTTKSLTHAIAEEHRPLTRDEIDKNEHNCRECYCEGMAKNKCNCHCHRTTQQMTTKGLKWAIKHNKKLGEFDEHMKRIADLGHEDICSHIKNLFTNPNMDKHLSQDDKMNMLSTHIEREQCTRCEMFLEEHPEFFKIDK